MPQFSVIVPLYNKAPYIRKALKSVMSQTFRDFELIIVDDGSTDGSADVVRDFISTFEILDFRLQILRQDNAGVAAARNKGVAASQGEFLCFLDADDWWVANFLEELDKLIAEYPEAGLYATNFVYFKPGKTHIEHHDVQTGYINYPEVYYRTGSMPVWTGAACMPRMIFDAMGGFPVGIKLGEDFLLWAKTALKYPVVFCEKPLAFYNNDVPASLRATRNIHAPQYHKLFNLQEIENLIAQLPDTNLKTQWITLLDKHRVDELLEYWLDERYHNAAAEELEKVDWNKQPKSVVRMYKTPIWILKVKRLFMQVGSYIKQCMCTKYR